jgi:hypothetical protein
MFSCGFSGIPRISHPMYVAALTGCSQRTWMYFTFSVCESFVCLQEWHIDHFPSRYFNNLKTKSKPRYDRRSVGLSVLVSSPIWGIRQDLCYRQTFAVLSMWGALFEKLTGLSFTAVIIFTVFMSAFYIASCQELRLLVNTYYLQFYM